MKTQYEHVRAEGALLPLDLLQRIAGGDPSVQGLSAASYNLPENERLNEAASTAFNRLEATWKTVGAQLADASAQTVYQRWLQHVFRALEFGSLEALSNGITLGERRFALTHKWRQSPVHIASPSVGLDAVQRVDETGFRASAHGLVQDFLNRTDEYLWGIVTDGFVLRVLRDHHSLTRHAYVEFDLRAMFEASSYADFALFYRVCHSSRFEPRPVDDSVEGAPVRPEGCWLERWFSRAREDGVRALDRLRDGVTEAVRALGAGLVRHPHNRSLREALQSQRLSPQDFYRQLLRLVYRLVLVFVAEERGVLLARDATAQQRERYQRFYALRGIRELSLLRRGGSHSDLWERIARVFDGLNGGCAPLGIAPLGGYLFSPEAVPWMGEAKVSNEDVLAAFRALSRVEEGGHKPRTWPVDWRAVGAEELGSVYESLLELSPSVASNGTFELKVVGGNERKTTGSYYTPSALVEVLLEQALDPVLDEACAKPESEREAALLSLTVCDPACGSGHFLLAAARRIAKRLATERAHGNEPSPEAVRHALRAVIARCIYGVDINPMAVELCKVSLWMEALEPGLPLSFLDGHIQCGNALLGATPALMRRGIPEGAFEEIEGDDKSVVSALRKQHKSERAGQLGLGDEIVAPTVALAASARAVEARDDRTLDSVREKQRAYESLVQGASFQRAKFLADAWCAAFVLEKTRETQSLAITENVWRALVADPSSASSPLRAAVERLAQEYQFFHWQIAFPQVFGDERESVEEGDVRGWSGGFDVVLGNPPWERIRLEEKQFFAARVPEIASATSADRRRKMIAALESSSPKLFAEFVGARRAAEGQSALVRNTGGFPLCGQGDVNTYAVFAERTMQLLSLRGRLGIIVPSGIATDDSTKAFFGAIVDRRTLVSLFDFENKGLFAEVHSSFKFCLLAIAGRARAEGTAARFVFFAHSVADLSDPERQIELTAADIAKINPNTRTCPIFRRRTDARITREIYGRVPILIREPRDGQPGENAWGLKFATMFHMTNDSALFETRDRLEGAGWTLQGNVFARGDERMLPLYEAKMTGMYDHRAADVVLSTTATVRQGQPEELTDEAKRDAARAALPRSWVHSREVDQRLNAAHQSVMTLRDVTSATNERTVIASITPRVAAGNNLPLVLIERRSTDLLVALLACSAAFVLDFAARFKVGGLHLNFFLVHQFPIPAPSFFSEPCDWDRSVTRLHWLLPRVLELTYTAWDLEAFARDCGYEGAPFRWDVERRFELRCELDAAFFHWYGLAREDVGYVMETFPIVKRKDEAEHGGVYRTKERILALYDGMQRAKEQGAPWESALRPGPADKGVAHTSARPAWLPAWSETSAQGAKGEPGALVLEASEGAKKSAKGRGKSAPRAKGGS